MTAGYLLDTNHIGHAVTPRSIVRHRIVELRTRGSKVGTCIPVLCEIEAGIQQVHQPDAYRLNLERLLRQVRIWPIDRSISRHYGAIHQDLKRRGRVLSQFLGPGRHPDGKLARLVTPFPFQHWNRGESV